MFKPSLKRSLLNQTISTIEFSHTIGGKQKNKIPIQHYNEKIQQSTDNSYINMIPQFMLSLHQPYENSNKMLTTSPLNCVHHQYPASVQQLLKKNQVYHRNINLHKHIYWCHTDNTLILWQESPYICRQYSFSTPLTACCLSTLDKLGSKFRFRSLKIIVLSFNSKIIVYSVNQKTLQISDDLRIHYQINDISVVQKILIQGSKIILAGNTQQIMVFDLNHEKNRIQIKLPLVRKIWPNYRKKHQTKQIMKINKKLYILVQQSVYRNWIFTYLRSYYIQWLSLRQQQKYKNDQKEQYIDVYQQNGNKICLQKRITQKEIQKFIAKNYGNYDGQDIFNAFSICKMYKQNIKNNQYLGLVLKCGYCLALKSLHPIVLNDQPRKIPIPSPSQSLLSICHIQYRNNSLADSLGYNNLSILENCKIVFYGEERCDHATIQNVGQIVEHQTDKNLISNRKWTLFTLQGYYNIIQLNYAEILMIYLYANSSSQCIEQFIKIIGAQRLCSIILLLLIQKYQFNICNNLLNKIAMKQANNRDRNKNNKQNNTIQINLTVQLQSRLWQLLFTYENKLINYKILNNLYVHCSVFWVSIKEIFYKIVQNIMQLEVKEIKIRMYQVNLILEKLENFYKILEIKIKRQQCNISKEIIKSNQNQQKYNLYEYNKINDSKIENNESTLDISTFHQVIQSTSKMQKVILNAINKIVTMIEIFSLFLDKPHNKQIKCLRQCLTNINALQQIKKDILLNCNDYLLQKVEIYFPELHLNNLIKIQKWLKLLNNNNNSNILINTDLNKLIEIINYNNLLEIKTIFKNNPHKYITLQIKFILKISNNIQKLQYNQKYKLNNLQDLLIQEQLKNIKQKKNRFIKNVIQLELLIRIQITNLIQQTANLVYKNKSYDFQLMNTIKVVAEIGGQILQQHIQYQLRRMKMFDRIVQFKKIRNNSNNQFNWVSINDKNQNKLKQSTMNMTTMNLSSYEFCAQENHSIF